MPILEAKKTLELNEDAKLSAVREIKNINFCCDCLSNALTGDGKPERDYVATLLRGLEGYSNTLSSLFGVETEKQDQEEALRESIRHIAQSVQKELDHLKRQLGEGVPVVVAKTVMEDYFKSISAWWLATNLGTYMGVESRMSLRGSLCLHLDICLSEMSSVFSDTPASDKDKHVERINYLTERYQLVSGNRRDVDMLDVPDNRTKIAELVMKKFPDAIIKQFKNRPIDKNGLGMALSGIELIVHNYG